MGRVLVGSPSSFLARAFLATMPAERVVGIGHGERVRPAGMNGLSAVLAFGRDPDLGLPGWSPERDATLRLADIARERDLPFLFLSTRKVYASDDAEHPLGEDAPLGPTDAYGRGKLALERALADRLAERLTVLRLGNIFGFEAGHGRRTFAGILLDRLRADGRIAIDVAATTRRDFLPVGDFARILARLVEAPPGGMLNVGSGVGLELGRIAACVIEGYGAGRLDVLADAERDGFTLDCTRLSSQVGPLPERDMIEASWRDLGRALRA